MQQLIVLNLAVGTLRLLVVLEELIKSLPQIF